jgi:hypothetical protein
MLRRDLEIFCFGTAIIVVFRSKVRPVMAQSARQPMEGRLDNQYRPPAQAASRLVGLDFPKFFQCSEWVSP